MDKFIISTDNVVELYKSHLDEIGIPCIPIKYILDGKEYAEVFDSDAEYDKFYDKVKAGAMPTTTQLNPEEFREFFEKVLAKNKGKDLIHVSFSGGLSPTANNAKPKGTGCAEGGMIYICP